MFLFVWQPLPWGWIPGVYLFVINESIHTPILYRCSLRSHFISTCILRGDFVLNLKAGPYEVHRVGARNKRLPFWDMFWFWPQMNWPPAHHGRKVQVQWRKRGQDVTGWQCMCVWGGGFEVILSHVAAECCAVEIEIWPFFDRNNEKNDRSYEMMLLFLPLLAAWRTSPSFLDGFVSGR